MKRIIVIAGLVLGLGALGLFGSTPAHADPGGCTDGGPPGETGTHVTPWGPGSGPVPMYLGAEAFTGPYYGAGLCWIVPPGGVWGGNTWTWATVSGSPGDQTVSATTGCLSQPGIIAPSCNLNSSADTTDDGNPGTVGTSTDATVGVVGVGRTGAEVGMPAGAPNEPGGGDGTGANLGVSVCTWANGVLFCPTSAPATVTVAEDDLVPVVETAPSCVYLDGDCLVPTVSGARVTLFPDTANDTIVIETPPDYDRTDVDRTCIGVNYACP